MKKSIPSFISKTYQFLESPLYEDIVSWNEDGTGFVVKNVSQFAQVVLPMYFKHSNFSSFVRQLNMYDFHKSRAGYEFQHPLFLRDHKELLEQVKRKVNNLEVCNLADQPTVKYEEISTKYDQLTQICTQVLLRNHSVLKENKWLQKHLQKQTTQVDDKGALSYSPAQLCLTNGDIDDI